MVTLRQATADDIDFLAGVQRATDPTLGPADLNGNAYVDWTREQVEGRIPHSTTYVVESGEERVGRLRIVRPGDRIEIAGIQLLPACQSRGIGTAVITEILREARAAGVPVTLTVSKDNPNAERLYTRLGFVRVGEQDDDYLMSAPK